MVERKGWAMSVWVKRKLYRKTVTLAWSLAIIAAGLIAATFFAQ